MKPPLPPVLEVARLRIAREGKVILKGIDWTVRAGEHWVLLGRMVLGSLRSWRH